MCNHAVIKIYDIRLPADDIEVIVEEFIIEVQENFLSYPFSSEILHIYKLSYTMVAVFIVVQVI